MWLLNLKWVLISVNCNYHNVMCLHLTSGHSNSTVRWECDVEACVSRVVYHAYRIVSLTRFDVYRLLGGRAASFTHIVSVEWPRIYRFVE
jgi:hypothetical protein